MRKKITSVALILSLGFILVACDAKPQSDGSFDYMAINLSDYIVLGNYKGLEIDMTPEPTDADVDNEISQLLLSYESTEEIKDRAAALGDNVNIDFKGYVDGELLSGGSADAYVIELGSNSFIDGFETGLVGVMPGSSVTLELVFPDPYKNNPDLAGSPVTFEVTLNWIEEYSYPEYTDEFVQEISDYETVAEYTEYLRSSLAQSLADDMATYKTNYLLEMVFDSTEVKDYPASEYDYYYNDMVSYYSDLASDNGMTLVDMMSYYYNLTEEEFYNEAKQYAYEAVVANLIVAAIAKNEGITLTDAEYDAGLSELASSNGYEDVTELESLYGKKFFELRFIKEKVLALIDENSVTVD